jgi:hypothetical protein
VEELAGMNVFAALFGIFRQRGLVASLKEGRPLGGFTAAAVVVSVLGGVLYGFAMGIGLGPETALQDALKLGLIITLGLLFGLPIFWLAFRLLGREERPAQIAAVPLTFVTTAAIVLAVSAPVVFLLSLLAGFSPEGIYIHIVLVDLAALVGLYLAGTLVYHGFIAERSRLIVPNVLSFLMLAVILVVLTLFFGPFLALSPTFSVGTDLLKDRLGIGVAQKAANALSEAGVAENITYRFQVTNQNGDLERDETVTRAGDDYLVVVHRYAVPGQTPQTERHIWVLGGMVFTDFDAGRVTQTNRPAVSSLLDPALPPAAFRLPDALAGASWRGYEQSGVFTAVGTAPSQAQIRLSLDAQSLRLSGLTLGSAGTGRPAETRVSELGPASLDQAGVQSTLNQAIVLGSVDRTDASMQDYAQPETFFVVRFPRAWHAGSWDAAQRQIGFAQDCGQAEGCAGLKVTVYDLSPNTSAAQYAADLAASLTRQPQYRNITANQRSIGNAPVGVVEYLSDQTVKGQIVTTGHIEYIFVGSLNRVHLDFSAPEAQFEANRALFEAMAGQFTYLKSAP